MSELPNASDRAPDQERRSKPRRRCERLAYVRCGPDNGGILLDVSEAGLSYQGVGTMTGGELLTLAFLLPGTSSAIEAKGRLVWTNDSKKGGGLQFVDLDEKAQEKIRHWVAGSDETASKEPIVVLHGVPDAAAEPADRSVVTAGDEVPDTAPVAAAQAVQQPEQALPAKASDIEMNVSTKSPAAKTPFLDGMRRSQNAAASSVNPQEVAPRTQRVPLQTAPSSSSESPSFALSSPEPEPKRRILVTGIPERGSRTAVYALAGAFVCVVVLAAMLGFFRSHMVQGVLAGQPFALGQPLGSTQDFHVEAFDLNNRHWTLSNEGEPASGAVQAAPVANVSSKPAPPAPAAVATPADPPRKKEVQLALSAPRVVSRQPSGDRQEAALSDNFVAPGVTIDPRSVGTGVPNLPAPPAAPTVSPAPVQQHSAGVQQAVLIKRVEPSYPPVARQLRVEGIVQVQAAIDRDGVPHELKVVNGDPRLTESALIAVRQWRFKPAQLDGTPIESSIVIQVQFRLAANQ